MAKINIIIPKMLAHIAPFFSKNFPNVEPNFEDK